LLKHLRQKEKDYIYSFGKGEIESLVSNYGWLLLLDRDDLYDVPAF
jgi:hypothetical protein